MYGELAILTVFAFCYSLVAGRFERSIISGPILFVASGFILGPFVLGWFKSDITYTGLHIAADLTLALVLFCDAASSNLSTLKPKLYIPSRMLIFGLPGAIILGTLVGLVLFPQLTFYEIAALATMLAATDAALGKAVVTNKRVPGRLREGLNIESGLNDGICVPILLVFLTLSSGNVGDIGHGGVSKLAFHLIVEEIGIGLLVGLGLTALGTYLYRICNDRGIVTEIWKQTTVVSLAFSCFFIAQTCHGSGYIAAFTGGLLFGYLEGGETHKLVLPAEGVGEVLALFTWMLFGAIIIGNSFAEFTWSMLLYAVLSLTVIRMLPIFLCLSGTTETPSSKLFLGWFGPRGLASIVFAVIVFERNLPGSHFIAMTVVCTVFLSLIVHGVSAKPLTKWIATKNN